MKYCKCGKNVRDNQKTCPYCEYKFEKDDKFLSPNHKILQKYAARVGAKKGDRILYIPSGNLSELPEFENTEDWIYKIIDYYQNYDYLVLPETILYIVNHKYGHASEQAKELKTLIPTFFVEFEGYDGNI